MKPLTMFALMLACLSCGVAAQVADKDTKLGSRIPQRNDWNTWPQAKVRDVQHRFGACVVKKRANLAARYVLELYDKNRTPALIDSLDPHLGNCLVAATASMTTIRMSFPADMLKYALADALVQSELARSAPLTDIASVAPLAHGTIDPQEFLPPPGKSLKPAELKELDDNKTKAQVAIYLSQFGECVVRADPADSHALLMANPDTAAESAAFGRLGSALGNCLDRGRQLALNKTVLRGTLALNYYRLVKAPRIVAPTAPGTAK